MRKSLLHRRSFLHGVGAGAFTLPFLRALSAGAETPFPKRLIIFTNPEGTVHNKWDPGIPDGPLARLSELLAPLEPHKDELVVINGIDGASARGIPGWGAGHGAIPHMLTGIKPEGPVTVAGAEWPTGAGGPSIDQVVAAHIGKTTRFRSLQLGVRNHGAGSKPGINRISYRAAGAANGLDNDGDPYHVYTRLFGAALPTPGGSDKNALEAIFTRKKSMLDAVRGDLADLSQQLGAADRQKLEQHLSSLRDIEVRLDPAKAAAVGPGCAPPVMAGNKLDFMAKPNYPTVMRAQIDLGVAALACDLTRVVTIQACSSYGYDLVATWLGISKDYHDISHNTGARMADRVKIELWQAEQFAYLLTKLKAIPEGNGTMLDNTLAVWCSSLGIGAAHLLRPWAWVLAGKAGGYLKTGVYRNYGERFSPHASSTKYAPHNRLLISIAHAMGMEDMTVFGDPQFCAGGPLERLKA